MLKAAYCAGVAFTKSYVGYVHAVAHSLGGQYGTPHGLANAVNFLWFCVCMALPVKRSWPVWPGIREWWIRLWEMLRRQSFSLTGYSR